MNLHVFFCALCFVGCTKFDSDTGSQASDGMGSSDDDQTTTAADSEHGGLTDLTAGLDRGGCDIQEATDTALAGATSYFYGLFKKTDSGYSGYELWILYANETWRAQGYEDCVIRWNASAVETAPSDSVAATLGLSVTLTLDQNASTCPDGPNEIGDTISPSGTVQYNVQVSDENTEWYFAESGEPLGSGLQNGNAMNYITPKSCRWF